MNTYTQQFASSCGYSGNSPAMLATFEGIRQSGIREARRNHFRFKDEIDELKDSEEAFFAAIYPAQSIEEAIEAARREVRIFWNQPTYRRERIRARLVKANRTLIMCRYFRRFGFRVWAQEAA